MHDKTHEPPSPGINIAGIDLRYGKVTQIVGSTLKDDKANAGATGDGSTDADVNFISEKSSVLAHTHLYA